MPGRRRERGTPPEAQPEGRMSRRLHSGDIRRSILAASASHHLASHTEHRPDGVADMERGIHRKDRAGLALWLDPVQSAHDTCRYGAAETNRIADHQHRITRA